MPADELVMFLHTEMSAISRGRAVPTSELDQRLQAGVGWVPANAALTPFGNVADPNPWGSVGDVRLLPDPQTEVRLGDLPGRSPLHFYQCDVVNLDGTGWPACPRVYLKRVLEEFASETGLQVVAAFEHEFYLRSAGAAAPLGAPFSLEALRQADWFGPRLVGSLREAGLEPETFLPEYGPGQFEVTCLPAPALQAADRAVAVRVAVREVARSSGWRATFTPVVDPAIPANGVHIHLSFRDRSGRPAAYDAAGSQGMSAAAARFAGGVLEHLPAVCAFAAPSMISYLRLTPHHWSASLARVANDREAAVRLPGIKVGPDSAEPGAQFNLEFRFPDAAACPHLALAILVRAGWQGIRDGTERATGGGGRIPDSLEAAMGALAADQGLQSWLPAELLATYTALKSAEIAHLRDRTPIEACGEYLDIY
ncbi:MAG TPA: glutamine synthetase family protein [Candidatus Dormibacteraeota bacterium]|jgi:glutamine synthetase